uniref:lytic transglycosylase domain-containing protein n=1 Tax=Neisseria leonii TaxID=2995413 RepID=UPI003F5894D6
MAAFADTVCSRRNLLGAAAFFCLPSAVRGAVQREETLADDVASVMRGSLENASPARLVFADPGEGRRWLAEMSRRLRRFVADAYERERMLVHIQYESARAGLDSQLILALIEVESAFRQYAVSAAGARGLMQVMPFWQRYIGRPEHNLFDVRTNLRYGCTVLRHYRNVERGDFVRALARYNGSLGSRRYPDAVYAAWQRRWRWP